MKFAHASLTNKWPQPWMPSWEERRMIEHLPTVFSSFTRCVDRLSLSYHYSTFMHEWIKCLKKS